MFATYHEARLLGSAFTDLLRWGIRRSAGGRPAPAAAAAPPALPVLPPGRRVAFAPVRLGSGAKCRWCYSLEVQGAFLRRGLPPLPACRRHYPQGLEVLVRYLRYGSDPAGDA